MSSVLKEKEPFDPSAIRPFDKLRAGKLRAGKKYWIPYQGKTRWIPAFAGMTQKDKKTVHEPPLREKGEYWIPNQVWNDIKKRKGKERIDKRARHAVSADKMDSCRRRNDTERQEGKHMGIAPTKITYFSNYSEYADAGMTQKDKRAVREPPLRLQIKKLSHI